MSIFLINLYYLLLLDVASTSPPNSRGFVSTSVSSSNSAITDYEVEVVEIRVQEGELKNIIPWVFFFSFCAVIHLPSIIIIHCLCLPAIVHHYFPLLGCFVISVFSYTHYIYLHEVDISFSFFLFPYLQFFFFFFYLLQSELHSTHTKLNLRLHRIASFLINIWSISNFDEVFFCTHTQRTGNVVSGLQ